MLARFDVSVELYLCCARRAITEDCLGRRAWRWTAARAPFLRTKGASWLAAREEARQRRGAAFDLKQWHTEALALGPVGLSTLTDALASLESR